MKMKKEVKIGIYAVVIILAAWAGIRFLSGIDIFGRSASYYAYYEQAPGLEPASSVVIRGVKVGQVAKVEVEPEHTDRVKVTFSVARSYKLPADSKAKLFSEGLMGGKAVEILLGESSEILGSGAEIMGENERDLMATVGAEIGDVKEKLMTLMENFNTTVLSLNGVLDDNRSDIAKAVGSLQKVLTELEKSNIVGNLESSTTRLDSIMVNVDKVVADLEQRQVVESIASTVDNLNAVLAEINNPDGTLGSLLNNKELYANLTQASANLEALLGDLKQNPHRYVHFSLFGADEAKMKAKAEKKAAKAEKKAAKAAAAAAEK